VIKPLGRYLINTPGFAGATTLGDGRIVLILDVVGLIESLNTKRIGKRKIKEKHFSQKSRTKSQITFRLHNVACSRRLFSWVLIVNGYGANISHENSSAA
jgi:two-component system chemotaxis sensor kinase CheA